MNNEWGGKERGVESDVYVSANLPTLLPRENSNSEKERAWGGGEGYGSGNFFSRSMTRHYLLSAYIRYRPVYTI